MTDSHFTTDLDEDPDVSFLSAGMKPEALVSFAIARRGKIEPEQVEALAVYGRSMRGVVHVLAEAFVAAEDYAHGTGSRQVLVDALEAADQAIEDAALDLYGDGWKAKVREGMGIDGDTAPTRK